MLDALTAARLSRWLPVDVDAAYARRALHSGRGAATVVEVVYYSCAPDAGLRERLHTMLQEQAGARAVIRDGARSTTATAPSGSRCRTTTAAPGMVVVVFALAQTPEAEVHGEFLERLRESARRAPAGS